ncbi:MAG: tRNA-intron lyase, partial [Candidatus Nitrosotenuis sp.]
GRMATSVKKHFILAIPGTDKVNYLALDWWRA